MYITLCKIVTISSTATDNHRKSYVHDDASVMIIIIVTLISILPLNLELQCAFTKYNAILYRCKSSKPWGNKSKLKVVKQGIHKELKNREIKQKRKENRNNSP